MCGKFSDSACPECTETLQEEVQQVHDAVVTFKVGDVAFKFSFRRAHRSFARNFATAARLFVSLARCFVRFFLCKTSTRMCASAYAANIDSAVQSPRGPSYVMIISTRPIVINNGFFWVVNNFIRECMCTWISSRAEREELARASAVNDEVNNLLLTSFALYSIITRDVLIVWSLTVICNSVRHTHCSFAVFEN